jgi:hypothetical protein
VTFNTLKETEKEEPPKPIYMDSAFLGHRGYRLLTQIVEDEKLNIPAT